MAPTSQMNIIISIEGFISLLFINEYEKLKWFMEYFDNVVRTYVFDFLCVYYWPLYHCAEKLICVPILFE